MYLPCCVLNAGFSQKNPSVRRFQPPWNCLVDGCREDAHVVRHGCCGNVMLDFFGEHPGILWINGCTWFPNVVTWCCVCFGCLLSNFCYVGCLLDVFCDVLEWLSRMSLRSDLEEWSHIATASRLSWLLALLTLFLVWRSMFSCLASALYCNQDAFLAW